jgi:hypothetical protein
MKQSERLYPNFRSLAGVVMRILAAVAKSNRSSRAAASNARRADSCSSKLGPRLPDIERQKCDFTSRYRCHRPSFRLDNHNLPNMSTWFQAPHSPCCRCLLCVCVCVCLSLSLSLFAATILSECVRTRIVLDLSNSIPIHYDLLTNLHLVCSESSLRVNSLFASKNCSTVPSRRNSTEIWQIQQTLDSIQVGTKYKL